LLSDVLPDIYKGEIFLQPLTQKNALKAIMEPCLADGIFASPKFEFEKQLATDLVEKLTDEETRLVDPIEIQIVCSSIEKKIIRKLNILKPKVTAKDIPPIGDMVNEFYLTAWEAVRTELRQNFFPPLDENVIDEIKKKIISKLVVGDHRNLVNDRTLLQTPDAGVMKTALNTLVSQGLLRLTTANKDKYYQLCHDRFIKSVSDDMLKIKALELAEKKQRKMEEELRKRKEKERIKRKFWLLGGLAILSLMSYIIYDLGKEKRNSDKQKILDFAQVTRRTNPQLSFLIAQSWINTHGNNTAFTDFTDSFREPLYPYLLGIYYQPSSLYDALITHDHLYVLSGKSFIDWNTGTKLIAVQQNIQNGICLRRFLLNGNVVILVLNGKFIELRNNDQMVLNRFAVAGPRPVIAVPRNGKMLLVDDRLYDTESGRFITLPAVRSIRASKLTSAVFMSDGTHLAAAYGTGYKIIYSIAKNNLSEIRISLILSPSGHQLFSAVNAIDVDPRGRYLVAGNIKNEVEIWKLPDLKSLASSLSLLSDNDRFYQILKNNENKIPIISKGHSDNVLSVAVSPDGRFALSGSRDHFAILWNLSNGSKIRVLKGMSSSVIYTAISSNAKDLITAAADGEIFVWSTENIQKLYREKRLSPLSPFDYYNAGLAPGDALVEQFFDNNTGVDRCYQRLFDYISNMPQTNPYPNDDDYLTNLRTSYHQIDSLYINLTLNKNFALLSAPQKNYIKQLYFRLGAKKSDLINPLGIGGKAKLEQRANLLITNVNKLIHNNDTSDFRTALVSAEKLRYYAVYFIDSAKNYTASLNTLGVAGQLISKYQLKDPDNPDLMFQQTVITYYQALDNLYLHNISAALEKAKALSHINNGNELHYVIEILGFLYQNDYDHAWQLFKRKEKILVWTGDAKVSLKTRLIYILNGIKDRDLLTDAGNKFSRTIQIRSNPGNLIRPPNDSLGKSGPQ
jgi:WD40 repeat protein